MSSGSCELPTLRISRDASRCWHDTNSVRQSPVKLSRICRRYLAAPTLWESRWLLAQPASTPRWNVIAASMIALTSDLLAMVQGLDVDTTGSPSIGLN